MRRRGPGPAAGALAGADGGRRAVRRDCGARALRDARMRGCEGGPASAFADGSRRARLGRPLLLSRGSPLPAGSAPDRRRNCDDAPPRRGRSQLLAQRLRSASPAGVGGGARPESGSPGCPIDGPLGSRGGDHWRLGQGWSAVGGAAERVERCCGGALGWV